MCCPLLLLLSSLLLQLKFLLKTLVKRAYFMTKSLSFSGGLIILPDLVHRSGVLEPSLGLGEGVILMGCLLRVLAGSCGWICWLDLVVKSGVWSATRPKTIATANPEDQ